MTAEVARTGTESPQVAALAENFIVLMRTFNKARARLLAAADREVEWTAHLLLKCIADSDGPMRAGALAECVQSDPSTVSRQVAALVKDGYLVRHADPDDGRASLLVLTPHAETLLAEHDQVRLEFFAGLVHDWSDADLEQFAAMLDRFTRAYEAGNTNWIAERIAKGSGRTGSMR